MSVVGLALLLAACGGEGAPAETASTASSTLVPPPAAGTVAPPRTVVISAGGTPGESMCPDPYADGVPYAPTPDATIRLVPQGSPTPLSPYRPLPFDLDPALEQVVQGALGDEAEHVAVVVKNLSDGRGVALDADREFYAASLYKTWVMLEAFHQHDSGLLDWEERFIVSDRYGEFSLNPGELAVCDEVSAAEALDFMMRRTDNVAANLLQDRVGAGNINRSLRGLGLQASGLVTDGSLPTTAGDMALLLEAVARRQAVSDEASDEMLALLASESIDDRLPALLPEGTEVAHKTGNWEDATHDAGIVFSPGATYIIVVLTDYGFQDDGATPVAELSLAVYEYFNQD